MHQTRDGALVVHHDATIHTGPHMLPRRIKDMTYAETQGYPLAPNITIPTLGDVLHAAPEPATVYIEVKVHGIEAAVVEAIGVAGARDRCAIHSFDHRVAGHVATLDRQIPTGILVASYLIDPAHALRAAGARDYWVQWDFIDAALVAAIHAAGGRVIAWTVNAPAAAEHLTALGVDGLCTDVCGEFRTG